MRSLVLSTLAFLGLGAVSVTAAPFHFPLPDGFPNPNPQQTIDIEIAAFGTLPNGPPPGTLSADGLTSLKLIALNEIFEVAFFYELVQNITDNVPGYEIPNHKKRSFVLATLSAVLAQEQLHALNANGALAHFGAQPIQPCQYNFPVSTFDEAITLAATFTSVVLGTLQDVTQIFAQNGDVGLTRAVASVIGQEGEQEGWYRLLQGKIPSELPFLTTSTREFAFTAINSFAVPGSCPNVGSIPLKTFLPLTLLTPPGPKNANLNFTFQTSSSTPGALWVAYINQQNVPIITPLNVESKNGGTVNAWASFPYEENELNGLTIAALVPSAGPFADADAVAQVALYGPALIIVN